jgi:hypothetical protein
MSPYYLYCPGSRPSSIDLESRPGAVGDFKLGVETLEVALDSGEAQVQLIGDLTVGLAGAKGAQHLELASSERLAEGLLTLPGGRLVEWFFLRSCSSYSCLSSRPSSMLRVPSLTEMWSSARCIRYGGVSGSTSGVRSLGGS